MADLDWHAERGDLEDLALLDREPVDEALERCRARLPAALALHSGPSKSADIGRVLVSGVHGPGRIVAAILGATPPSPT